MENCCNDLINYVEIKSARRINLSREASICPLTTHTQGPDPSFYTFLFELMGFIMGYIFVPSVLLYDKWVFNLFKKNCNITSKFKNVFVKPQTQQRS